MATTPRRSVRYAQNFLTSPSLVERLLDQPGAALVEHAVHPDHFARPNLVLRGVDGINHGISDVMSPWSAAVAEPECR